MGVLFPRDGQQPGTHVKSVLVDFPALGKQGNNRDKVGQRGGRDTDDWMSCVSAASTMLALHVGASITG